MSSETGKKDTLTNCFNLDRYESEHAQLHYRIVYELMRDIVLLQDRIKELEKQEKKC